jgi:hypothetical protein
MDRSAPTSHKSASKSLMIPSKHRLHHTHETKKNQQIPNFDAHKSNQIHTISPKTTSKPQNNKNSFKIIQKFFKKQKREIFIINSQFQPWQSQPDPQHFSKKKKLENSQNPPEKLKKKLRKAQK